MRWLIAVGVVIALSAGAARAQSPTAILCARYDGAWARVGGGTDTRAMEAVIATIPAICPVKVRAERRLAAVKAGLAPRPPRPSETASVADDATFDAAQAADTVAAYDHYLAAYPKGRHVREAAEAREALAAAPPAPAPAPGPPPGPVDPCSQEAVDARDPTLPRDGPDPAWPARSRAAYAARYAARAEAFKAVAFRCGTLPAALANYGFAVSLDHSAPILAARAELYFDMGDYDRAIADYSGAISQLAAQPPDRAVLLLYANRAAAYSKLGMHTEEIADLRALVDEMGQLNSNERDGLLPSSVYKDRLARAYYAVGDLDDAETEFGFVEPDGLDWQDLYFIGSIGLQKKEWDKAIAAFGQAQAKLATQVTGEERVADRALLEVALGKAYAARDGAMDARNAWDSYQSALADAPGNADAVAGLGGLKGPPPKPTFAEPELAPLAPPDGVSDLDHLDQDTPRPFCSQNERNEYLTGQVSHLTDLLNRNMSALALYSASLETLRSQYAANTLLRYPEKIAYLGLIDAEIKSVRDRHEQLSAWGYAVIRYFNRIKDDPKLVTTCLGAARP